LQIYRATRALHEFILGDLSRWYIPLIRQRTWIEKDDPVKISAYAVLYEVLTKLVVMLAPIAPHITEEMYQNLMGKKESVHLENMATPDENAIDLQLEEDMKIVRKYAEAEASAREKKGIKRRWPVIRSYAQVKDEDAKRALEDLKEVVETATNTLSFEVKGPEDKIDIPEVYSSASFEFGIVYIDAREDDNLKSLRYAREVVRRIQEMRKEQDLDVEAFIEVRIEVRDREIVTLLNKQRGYISRETRAKGLDISEAQKHLGYKKKWDIENTNFIISINEVTA
jgi:isoleucyl-tRNA synthetase